MKYFVLVMLLSASPVLADSEEYEYGGDIDDVECHLVVDGFTITYTYSYKDSPEIMPVEGLMCYPIGEYEK